MKRRSLSGRPSGRLPRRTLAAAILFALAPAALLAIPLAAPPAADPLLLPDSQRAFLQDGPGLLLSEDQRQALLEQDEAARGAWIASFLDKDPLPATPENELRLGIARRQRLATVAFGTPLDVRWKLVFLNGMPDERKVLDCGTVYIPVEVWTYYRGTDPNSGKPLHKQLVVFQSTKQDPWRLWLPSDGKRALYTDLMQNWMEQWEQIRGSYYVKRIDKQNCDDVELVDEATGVEGLTGWLGGQSVKWKRPKDTAWFLAPPADLAVWAKAAAATLAEAEPAALKGVTVDVHFPEEQGQRILARTLITLPPGAGYSTAFDGKPGVNFIAEGLLESRGRLFESFRMRFRLPLPKAGDPIVLAIDRLLRSGEPFLLRCRLIDEASKAELSFTRSFSVPAKAISEGLPAVVQAGELLPQAVAQGKDSLVLMPPAEDVVVGTWRADTLVSGDRIQKVTFLVDGKAQLTTTKKPFSAEVRLDRFPTEQVVQADGYDAKGELVASDQIIVNLQRGSLAVRILEPGKGAKIGASTHVRAEIVVPDEHRVQSLELKINDEKVASIAKPPWEADLKVPDGELVYLTAVAILDDGSTAEAVRYLHAPRFVQDVEVNLVEMYVSVTDSTGGMVRNLKQDDFEVLEDGRKQAIAKFELVDNLPLTVGVLLDTSGSMSSTLVDAQKSAGDFLTSVMRPSDKAFAVSFAGRPRLDMPLTDDVGALVQALTGLQAVGDTALHDAMLQSLYYFRGLHGQRALVLLSDGDDNSSNISYDDALEYARRSGVAIYTIGFHLPPFEGGIRAKLERFASDTGGRSFFTYKPEDLPGIYKQIESELRSRYLVAFNSDSPSDKPGFRQVDIKVKGGLKARTARGYYP